MYQFTFQCSWKFRNSIASRYLSKLIWYYHKKIIKTILGIWHQINTCCRWAKQNYIKIRYKQWKRIFPIDFIAFIGINFSDLIIKNKLMFTQHLPSSFFTHCNNETRRHPYKSFININTLNLSLFKVWLNIIGIILTTNTIHFFSITYSLQGVK